MGEERSRGKTQGKEIVGGEGFLTGTSYFASPPQARDWKKTIKKRSRSKKKGSRMTMSLVGLWLCASNTVDNLSGERRAQEVRG